MGYKNVCTYCKTSFSKGMDYNNLSTSTCPECKNQMILVNHKFKPPKKRDNQGWKLVKLLLDNGFRFNAVYTKVDANLFLKVCYPKTLDEAKEFIKLPILLLQQSIKNESRTLLRDI